MRQTSNCNCFRQQEQQQQHPMSLNDYVSMACTIYTTHHMDRRTCGRTDILDGWKPRQTDMCGTYVYGQIQHWNVRSSFFRIRKSIYDQLTTPTNISNTATRSKSIRAPWSSSWSPLIVMGRCHSSLLIRLLLLLVSRLLLIFFTFLLESILTGCTLLLLLLLENYFNNGRRRRRSMWNMR